MEYVVLIPFPFPPAGVLSVGQLLVLSDELAAPLLDAGLIEPLPPAD